MTTELSDDQQALLTAKERVLKAGCPAPPHRHEHHAALDAYIQLAEAIARRDAHVDDFGKHCLGLGECPRLEEHQQAVDAAKEALE